MNEFSFYSLTLMILTGLIFLILSIGITTLKLLKIKIAKIKAPLISISTNGAFVIHYLSLNSIDLDMN